MAQSVSHPAAALVLKCDPETPPAPSRLPPTAAGDPDTAAAASRSRRKAHAHGLLLRRHAGAGGPVEGVGPLGSRCGRRLRNAGPRERHLRAARLGRGGRRGGHRGERQAEGGEEGGLVGAGGAAGRGRGTGGAVRAAAAAATVAAVTCLRAAGPARQTNGRQFVAMVTAAAAKTCADAHFGVAQAQFRKIHWKKRKDEVSFPVPFSESDGLKDF